MFKKCVYDEFILGNQPKQSEKFLDSENNTVSTNSVLQSQSLDFSETSTCDNESLIGWLSFLVTEIMSDVENVIKHFPWLEELYMEMAAFKNDPDEILRASSEALAILDRNTMQYVIDEMAETIDKQQKALDVNSKKLDDANKQLDNANKQLNDAKLLHARDSAVIEELTNELKKLKEGL